MQNTGFAKVESRNDICKIQIHLQGISEENGELQVYAFVREGEWLKGILLGKASIQMPSTEIKIMTPSEHVGNVDYELENLAGLWISSDHGGTYLSVWDDEPVEVQRLVTEIPGKKEADRGQPETESEETQQIRKEVLGDIPIPEEKSGEEGVQIDPVSENNSLNSKEAAEENKAESKAEKKENIVQTEEASGENQAEKEEASGGNQVEAEEASGGNQAEEEEAFGGNQVEQEEASGEDRAETEEAFGETKQNERSESNQDETDSREEGTGESLKAESVPEQENQKNGSESGEKIQQKSPIQAQEAVACPMPQSLRNHCRNCAPGLDQRWQCLSRRYSHIQPFEGEEVLDCIRICPRDLGALRQNQWQLGRNSFLMHGYYNYRHLLFGKCRDGSFFLGIPGIKDSQEEFMASMFGFPNFRKAAEQKGCGIFGYWCRPVE